MALHRDIFWIGRQWAVTGFGMQAVNQKLFGEFDVEIARLWDDDWLDVLRAQQWLNAEDFAKGLAVARTRFPEPPRKVPPPLPIEALLQVIAAPATPPRPKPTPEAVAAIVVEPEKPLALPEAAPIFEPAAIAAVEPEPVAPQAEPLPEPMALDTIEPAEPTPLFLQMRVAAPTARLVKIWRVKRRQ